MDHSTEDAIRTQLESISNKRARIVIEHILANGQITTEEIRLYGYDHPPRAARDVREAGIPLETFRVKSSEGRSIGAYRFGDQNKIRKGMIQGRRSFPKWLKTTLYDASDGKCAICSGEFESRYLQIDHRIPYAVGGDESNSNLNLDDYMLLCGSCNRAKSWSCEHCTNSIDEQNPEVCLTCYWAEPGNYYHIALREVRRVDILWSESEIEAYERLKVAAESTKHRVPDYVKKLLAQHFDQVDD